MDEPYRMFTSRAEYRILLRQDNADMRLTPYAEKLGIACEERKSRFHHKKEGVEKIIDFCRNFSIKSARINPFLDKIGSTQLNRGCKLFDLISRP